MNKIEIAKSVIDVFNANAKVSIRKTTNHVLAVSNCIMDDGSNEEDLKNYVKTFTATDTDFDKCFESYTKPKKVTSTEDPRISELFASFLTASAKAFADSKSSEIEANVIANATSKLDDFIRDTYGVLPHKVELNINDDHQITIDGVVHKAFDEVYAYVVENEPVFLVGPAGSGKNFLCEQIAKACGLDFYFSNALTQEYFLTGFTDANGHYQPTQFYEAFTKGGLFLLDEIDASIPEVLIKLNAAIANRYFDFPAPIGRVEAHPNFRVVAAGNTYGLGADFEYVGRSQLDAASLDRFGQVEVDYDENIELAKARGDKDLVDFVHDIRRICKSNGILFILSYRGIERLAKLKAATSTTSSYDLTKLLKSAIFKGLGYDDLTHLVNGLSISNEYTEAMKKLI